MAKSEAFSQSLDGELVLLISIPSAWIDTTNRVRMSLSGRHYCGKGWSGLAVAS